MVNDSSNVLSSVWNATMCSKVTGNVVRTTGFVIDIGLGIANKCLHLAMAVRPT